jgi:hypothetical protein
VSAGDGDHGVGSGDGAGEAQRGAPPADVPAAPDVEYRCDLCGAPMHEWHCRIICTFCGYQRDCSDP